jgi:hypothetical protein
MPRGIQELGIQEYGVRNDTSTFSSIKQEFIQVRVRILERSNNMIRNNIRNLVIGFAVGSLGLALAVAIPNVFSTGTVISSSAVNANFTEMKTAVDTLEAKVATLQAAKSLPGQGGYYAYAYVTGAGTLPGTGAYNYNPAGSITVTNSSAGTYAVTFNGTHPAINIVHVTPYNSVSYCVSLGWGPSNASIGCYNGAGVPTNTSFNISVSN